MAPCPRCGADLETPLVCTSCGALLDPPEGVESFQTLGPFALLGLPETFEVDAAEARKHLLRFGRHLHPDFFAAAGGPARARAEEATAALNWAHHVVADDFRRADWIVRSLGGPSESDERQMPQPFLMEVLEWSEALEEARASATGSTVRAGLPTLAETLRQRRSACLASVRRLLTSKAVREPEALRQARRELNAARYLDRALGELEALRLEEAASR